MNYTFYKYQGTGNDFILIDNRQKYFPKNNTEQIAQICDRKFGIGADGLILLENSEVAAFKMVYFNADGRTSTMCGNGGRCIIAFAHLLGIITNKSIFEAIDGLHEAEIIDEKVKLKMIDIETIESFEHHIFLDSGSPHHVSFITNIDSIDIKTKGSAIRYGSPYFEEGSNVNFVEQLDENTFKVRTYERGVEDETLSCGTGVTAVAVAAHKTAKTGSHNITLKTPGGDLEVSFEPHNNSYKNVFLKGPATLVFKGEITI